MDIRYFVSGSCSTIGTAFCMQPLDVIKTFYLYQHEVSTISGCVKHINKNFGLKGFWKGYSASFARSVVGGGFTFFWYETIRNYIGSGDKGVKSFFTDSMSSMLGRTMAITIQCPLSVIKVKLENPIEKSSNTMASIAKEIYRTEGLRGYYVGLLPNILRDVPYTALAVPFYQQYVNLFETFGYSKTNDWVNFVAGGLGGGTACLITQPFDVIKTRAMSGYDFGGKSYRGIVTGMKYIYKNEGLKGFSKGLSIRLSERSLGQALIWTFYTKVKRLLNAE